ncbi:MAG: quercetin dioxygenase-like cupin family protein [Natronomonas sp.]|jgi:quercetin dioxygenase-like cupin family protein|uniref:cupin domain-containing protein n=1 Tax=Natronomonas sp. TaxID=2184060 RepID=UPI003988B042
MQRVSTRDVDPSEPVEDVFLGLLASGEETSLQHFEIDPGATVPEHSHPHEQTGFVYEGTLTFVSGGETVVVEAGDSFSIPGNEPHSAENRSDVPVRGIDVFAPPRTDPDWVE